MIIPHALNSQMFGLYDRVRPPGMSAEVLWVCAVLLLVSLTHGHVPFGCSDVLLPTFVALVWVLELLPRYGGPVDYGQVGGSGPLDSDWVICVEAKG
jgi:hypothetical protein